MKIKILIVDDEKSIRDLLTVNLQQQKYDVSSAANGEDALYLLKFESYDVILLDLVMPKVYGLEFIEKLKTTYVKKPAIILMTAFSANEIIDEAIKNGAVACLHKPFDMGEVFNTIQRVISIK